MVGFDFQSIRDDNISVAEESPTAARILLGGELLSGFEIAFQPLVDWNESRSG